MTNPSQMTDDQLIARILEDAETATIAESLGLEPAEYAKRVMHYIRNPNADPQLQFMDAEAEKEAGVPTVADCVTFLEKVESGEIGGEHDKVEFAGFDDDEKSQATATGARPKKGHSQAPPMPGESTASREAPASKKTRAKR